MKSSYKIGLFITLFGFFGVNIFAQVKPYYTNVSKIAELTSGMELQKVNQILGVDPYDVLHMQADGSSLVSYKYRILKRRVKYRNPKDLQNAGSQNSGDKWYEEEGTLYVVFMNGKLQSMISNNGLENSVLVIIRNNVIQLVHRDNLSSLKDFKALYEEGTVYKFSGKKHKIAPITKKEFKGYTKNLPFNLNSISQAKQNLPTVSDIATSNQSESDANVDSKYSGLSEKEIHKIKSLKLGPAQTSASFTLGGINLNAFDIDNDLYFHSPLMDFALDVRVANSSTIGFNIGLFTFYDPDDVYTYNYLGGLYSFNYKYWLKLNTTNIKPYAQIGTSLWLVENDLETGSFTKFDLRLGVDLTLGSTLGIRTNIGTGPSNFEIGLVLKQNYKKLKKYPSI